MSFLRHRQIYQPMSLAKAWRRNRPGSVSTPIGSMSLQLAIPWQVALLQSLPPLHQPTSFSRQPAETVNRHHHKVGEFSPSRMRNFQPALTLPRIQDPRRPIAPRRDLVLALKHDELLNGGLSSFLCVAFGIYTMASGKDSNALWVQVLMLLASPALALIGGDLMRRQRQRRIQAA